MFNQEEPVISPLPTAKTEDDVPDSVPDSVPTVAIPMEYEPMRYGNSLNAKAVMSVQQANPDISFEQGESALEELGLRYKILRKRKHMSDVEVDSKEWYSGLCERTLMEARGHFDKAEQALSAGHFYMWHVYRFAIKAVDAPSVSREEYHRRRRAECERASQEAIERLQAEEWKKIQDLKMKGCKCFNEPAPGNTPTAAEVERFRLATGAADATAAVSSSTDDAGQVLEGEEDGLAGAAGGSSEKKQNKRRRQEKADEERQK